jgi:hypothetical protein
MKNSEKIVVRRHEGTNQLQDLDVRWKANAKSDLKEIGSDSVEGI